MGMYFSREDANIEAGQDSDIGSSRFMLRHARREVENKLKDFGGYLPLYKASLRGDWNEARKFLDEDPEALTAKITITSETALHIAVGTGEAIGFVEKMVRKMCPEDLATTDQNGETALSVAAVVGNLKAAKLLVNKNPDLPNISGKSGLPIHKAAEYGHRDMILYLLEVTTVDVEPSPFAGESGGRLLIAIITAEFFDIALELIDKFPELATVEVNGVGSPLMVLASKTAAFPSASLPTNWQHLFYKPLSCIMDFRRKKLVQQRALVLVKSLCIEICELDDARAFTLLQQPLHQAATLGIPEIIEEIVDAFPPVIWSSDEEKRNVFQLAVLHRREKVFSLIYQMSSYRQLVTRYVDPNGNNILHLAGKLPSPDRLNLVSGAALQLQRELKWFKAVEDLVQPAQKEAKNNEGKTPAMVFQDTHQELRKDGETWMRNTSTSCTVVTALIATGAFAAVIHLPGGHDGSGFRVFSVIDAISLFSSVTSILMFLSILTSRYSQHDFLLSLPRRLIIALTMLFVSIWSMMGAFAAAIILAFGPKKATRLIPLGAVPVVFVTIFVLLPPLYQIIKSTCCGIFQTRRRRELRSIH